MIIPCHPGNSEGVNRIIYTVSKFLSCEPMNSKRILRFVGFLFLVLLGIALLVVVFTVAPIDRTVDRSQLTTSMMNRIDTLQRPGVGQQGYSIGFAKVNLTPSYPTATAGYGKRMGKLYESVLDSIFVRSMVVSIGDRRVAIVTADILIIPPAVTALLEKELPEIGFTLDNTYLGASHSHNSIGNWGRGVMGLLYGSYDDAIVHFIADQIKTSIQLASGNMLPATLKAGTLPLAHTVQNRLIDGGPVDSLLRVVEVHRSDSSKLLLMSFTAHATCLSSRDVNLSADYPGKLVDLIEEEGYTFAMFMAGAVGSHTGRSPEQGRSCVDWMANKVSQGFLERRNELTPVRDSIVFMHRVPLLLSPPQAKLFKEWRIRPWLFNLAFGDYPEYLTILRLGDIAMVGTPCDFSGEFSFSLDSLSAKHGLRTMVTSFNGGYMGYITPDQYYDVDHYETQLMNWYGPGNGTYMKQCIERLILKVAD